MTERKLVLSVSLKDCDVETKRGSGAGGQNRNKRDTAVKIIHRASGAIGESQEERSQLQNKRTAFKRMAQTPKFQAWLKRQMGHVTLAEIQVSEEMRPRNIRIEIKDKDGEWVETDLPTPDWCK